MGSCEGGVRTPRLHRIFRGPSYPCAWATIPTRGWPAPVPGSSFSDYRRYATAAPMLWLCPFSTRTAAARTRIALFSGGGELTRPAFPRRRTLSWGYFPPPCFISALLPAPAGRLVTLAYNRVFCQAGGFSMPAPNLFPRGPPLRGRGLLCSAAGGLRRPAFPQGEIALLGLLIHSHVLALHFAGSSQRPLTLPSTLPSPPGGDTDAAGAPARVIALLGLLPPSTSCLCTAPRPCGASRYPCLRWGFLLSYWIS